MSSINLTINVDDSLYKDFLEKEIYAFSKEEIHSIAKSVIEQILIENKDKIIESLFLHKQYSAYSSRESYQPTELLRDAAKKSIDASPAFDEIKDEVAKYLKENYKDIIVNCFIKMIADSLVQNSHNLQDIIYHQFNNLYNQRVNNS